MELESSVVDGLTKTNNVGMLLTGSWRGGSTRITTCVSEDLAELSSVTICKGSSEEERGRERIGAKIPWLTELKPLMTSTFATCSPLVTDQCMKANEV